MKELNLKVAKRAETGKGPNRRLRSDGMIPAVVYGPETEPIPVQINYRELYKVMHGVSLSAIINLEIDGDPGERKVLIRDLQKDPITGDLLHLDFHHIPMDKQITITIAVRTEGIPVGVKNFGGIVQTVRRDIEVSCLPIYIPEDVILDITELNIGDSLHVSDIKIDNVEILTNPTRTIVTVVAPTVSKEVTVAEEEAAAAEAAEAAEGEEAAEGGEKKGGEKKGGEKKGGEKKDEGKK